LYFSGLYFIFYEFYKYNGISGLLKSGKELKRKVKQYQAGLLAHGLSLWTSGPTRSHGPAPKWPTAAGRPELIGRRARTGTGHHGRCVDGGVVHGAALAGEQPQAARHEHWG
jgi:hypothetical protein